MSINTSNTPDGNGVLIYNGETILLYSTGVKFNLHSSNSVTKGEKSGAVYLTSHRIIFMNGNKKDGFKSFAMPFHALREVKLEQPLLGSNFLKGGAQALPGGNCDGECSWKMFFPKGGCIDFGQALLRAADIASRMRPFAAPPQYVPFPEAFFAAPQDYYIPPTPQYHGFTAPTNVFPEKPAANNVYMYDQPPPYAGIGPVTPYPAGSLQFVGNLPPQQYSSAPSAPPAYQPVHHYENAPGNGPPGYSPYAQAPPLPQKQ